MCISISLRWKPHWRTTSTKWIMPANGSQRLEKAIDEGDCSKQLRQIRAVIEALQALRGVAQMTAVTIVCRNSAALRAFRSAPVDGLQRTGIQRAFQRKSHSTRSDHQDRQRSSATSDGGGGVGLSASALGRRLPAETTTRSLDLSEEIKEIAWKAQQRLHTRYKKLAARGKEQELRSLPPLARELLGLHLGDRRSNRNRSTNSPGQLTLDILMEAAADDRRGPTKRRTLLTFYAVRSPGPTPRTQSEAAPDGS